MSQAARSCGKDLMQAPLICRPTLRVNPDSCARGQRSVSVCCLGPELVAFLASFPRPDEILKSIFRVTIAQIPSPEGDSIPAVSGRYLLFEDEVEFVPHFPFETDVKYRATFDPNSVGAPFIADSLSLEFLMPSEQPSLALTEVTHIYPSCDLLPENLLRFYVCFSNSMQRGRALEQISLLNFDRRPVADALYRPPVELWDRSMRHLTVLLDPGRLKRWVGPNVELGPPLKVGQEYTLEIGSGMIDLYGRSLAEPFSKHFVVGDPVREPISVENWKILPPATFSRQALVFMFPRPLDWALLLRTIRVESADGSVIDGQVAVDQCESQWTFTPHAPWMAGEYLIRIGSGLEDVCGNSVAGAFDRPLRGKPHLVKGTDDSSLIFQLI
jgi:hypothetical protein